jgi:aspartyl-tRNA(Asn)/glutamyl-tRNA(Gln) amidotransferase subunit C
LQKWLSSSFSLDLERNDTFMAELDKNMVQYLAKLSRIAVSEQEEEALLKDLAKIVSYVEQLNEVDTQDTPACNYVTEVLTKSPLRKDEIIQTLKREELMQLASSQIGGMIRVPPVIKQEG